MLRVILTSAARNSSKSGLVYGYGKSLSTMRYTKSHEYVKMDGDIATVGITDYAAAALGDVVFVDLPSVGKYLYLYYL